MRMFQVFPNALRKSIDILHFCSYCGQTQGKREGPNGGGAGVLEFQAPCRELSIFRRFKILHDATPLPPTAT